MSKEPDIERDDPLIAAEWSLGLLEGEELMAARGRYASDHAFAWRKDWWDNWFAPLADEVPGAEPSPAVWAAIAARVAAAPAAAAVEAPAPVPPAPVAAPAPAEVGVLRRQVRRWQWATGLAVVAAAVLLGLLAFGPGGRFAGPATPVAAAPLVATVPIGETGLRLEVIYFPESEQMLIGANGLAADGLHDHELWLVPSEGTGLVSLGVVIPGEVRSLAVPPATARLLHEGAGLVLTREPLGGKPAAAKAGPVVAKAALRRI